MGAVLKTYLAVEGTIPRVSDTSERESMVDKVHNALIEAQYSTRCLLEETLFVGRVMTEVVESKRLRTVVDKVDGFVDMLEGNYWKDWTKDLVDHAFRIEARVQDNCRINVLGL